MKPRGICRFCDIISGKYHYVGIDEPFASNDEFIAIASIGALIEGWTLIVPKDHQLSLRNIYKNAEFADFVNILLPAMVSQYGSSIIAFEHGANMEGSTTACGTDHAHLHLVPLGESLLLDLQNSGLQWVRCHVSDIASSVGENEYLFYSELNAEKTWKDPIGFLHVLERPISQYFRHLIAKKVGEGTESDYKRFPFLDTARHTRIMLVDKVA